MNLFNEKRNGNGNDNDDEDHSVSTFDSRKSRSEEEKVHIDERNESNDECIDRRSFLKKMYNLSRRKLWIETVSRRLFLLKTLILILVIAIVIAIIVRSNNKTIISLFLSLYFCHRSTILYTANRISTDEEIQQKFNLALSNGIKVRRHEKYKFAEVVTIYGEWVKNNSPNNEDIEKLFRIHWNSEVNFVIFVFFVVDSF